jgi:hypothetical protein
MKNICLLLTMGLILLACTTEIRPPQAGQERVFLVDHGRHASLVIQLDNRVYRYSYGDWDFYAEASPGFWNGLKAALWPTQGALGRKQWSGLASADNLHRHLPDGIEQIHSLQVEEHRARDLVKELELIFQRHQPSLRQTPEYNLEFVHHPQVYWILNNSNQMIGKWLEQLGCQINGAALFSRWEITPGH